MTAALVAVGNIARYRQPGSPRDARYQVSSLSKQFVAAAVRMLGLDLDESIRRWLPHARPKVTLRGLITHTAGVPHWGDGPGLDWSEPMELAQRAALIAEAPRWFEPGWHYSSPGYVLLGHIVSLVADQPYPEFLRERIFEPLGMKDTTVGPPPEDVPLARGRCDRRLTTTYDISTLPGTGDVWSTPTDLCSYAYEVHTGRLVPGSRPLVPVKDWPEGYLQPQRYGYGMFHGTAGEHEAVFCLGDTPGFRAVSVWLPHREAAITVLANDEAYDITRAVRRLVREATTY